MIECPQCFKDIFDAHVSVCPSCGLKLLRKRPGFEIVRMDFPGENPRVLDEEMFHFRHQFEERGLFLPESILKRTEEIFSLSESEMRRVSVLILDFLPSSYPGNENEAWGKKTVIQEFHRICTECIQRRGGYIVEFLDISPLAIFGSPVAFDSDTQSAVKAALDIQSFCTGELNLPLRIGIATGPVNPQKLYIPGGVEYHISGYAASQAAALIEKPRGPGIFVCPETFLVIDRSFVSEHLTSDNDTEEIIAYRISGEKEILSPAEIKIAPFCGREDELIQLSAFLNRPFQQSAGVAFVSGEDGIGKSRLIQESLDRLEKDFNVFWWRGQQLSEKILFYPVLQWLREEVKVFAEKLKKTSGDPENFRIDSEVLQSFVKSCFPGEEIDPLILEYLFGLSRSIEAMRGFPPERLQRNLFSLIRRLLFSEANSRAALVLIVDDVQYFDTMTRNFLHDLPDQPNSNMLSLIITGNSEEDLPYKIQPEHLRINLGPLSEVDRKELLQSLVPFDDFLPEIRKIVLSRSGGSPLFMEEMSRLIKETMQDSSGDDSNGVESSSDLSSRIIEIIPVSLRELIQSRIDRLESHTRQALQCASLMGFGYFVSLIDMLDGIRGGLSDHLHALRAMRYLGEQPEPKNISNFFTHNLFRDVAYKSLLNDQKKRLHKNLGHRLEEVFADRLQEYYELLAYHFSRGGDAWKAVYYLVKAADRQSVLGGNVDALENYTEAIELLQTLPSDHTRLALMARVLTRCGRIQRILGRPDLADSMLEGALECAEKLENYRLILGAKLEQAITMIWKGECEEAEEILEYLSMEARRLGASIAEITILNSLGILFWQKGSYDESLSAFKELANLAGENDAPQSQADAYNNAGLIYWRWGQYSEALNAYRKALPLRRKVGDLFGLCATTMNIGIIQEEMGEIGSARESYAKALQLAEKTGYVQAHAALGSNLSNLERRLGSIHQALEHAINAIEYSRLAEDPNLEAIAEENAGMAFVVLGDTETAREHFQNSLGIAENIQNREREISIRISILELDVRELTPDAGFLERINELLQNIEKQSYPEIIPRVYRLKSKILDNLDLSNRKTAREYLEMSRDLAHNSGNIFEEIDSLRSLLLWAEKHNCQEEEEIWKKDLDKLLIIIE
jgi:tetratricopeptide (TPR) repeat protein